MMDISHFLARLHLLFLHLPIGILALALLLAWLARRGQRTDFQSAIHLTLACGAVSAVLTAFFGWLLAGHGLYDPDTLFWHKWLGFGTAALAVAAWWWRESGHVFSILLASVAGMTAAGHFGGSLTHGPDYLTAAFSNTEALEQQALVFDPKPASIVFQDVVKPILDKKCVACHGPAKSKGKLRLDTPEGIRQGGESGKPMLAPGKPEASELWVRANLPMADEKHMPPSGRVQLSPDELVLLKWWIAEGADFQRRLADSKISPEVQSIFDAAKSARSASPVFSKKIKPADASALAELRQNGASVMPLGSESAWLSVSYAGQRDLTPQKIGLLKNVREQTTRLDLANTNLDASGLRDVAKLPHLTRLNLAGTGIADADLAALADLEFLENLNLTATAVSDAGLESLANLKKLKTLHLWKTQATSAGAEKLRAKIAGLDINLGAPLDSNAAPMPLRIPKIKFARSIFDDTVQVEFDKVFAGVDIFYGLDEASPTTVSPKFEGKPLVFDKTTRIRAFAARDGWANSPVAEAFFVKRKFSPKTVALERPPSPKYPAKGAASLHDGVIAENRGNNEYLGYEGEHITAVLDMGKTIDFQRLSVHCFEDNGSWIFAPKGLQIWTSDDGKRWQPCLAKQYPSPATTQPTAAKLLSEAPEKPVQARFLKVKIESLLKNPAWHAAPGGKCWTFVDEILVE